MAKQAQQMDPDASVTNVCSAGKDFSDRGNFGRLRAVTLIGINDFGEVFLSALERTGAFLVQEQAFA